MKNDTQGMTYAGSGVVYDDIDKFKLEAQEAALETAQGNPLKRLGFREVSESRGESVFLTVPVRKDPYRAGHVNEGLGTKNIVSDGVYKFTGLARLAYYNIPQDTITMAINDMATLGIFPLSVHMHLAAGSSDWFKDGKRAKAIIDGWRDTCINARCVWGGGETPVLKGLIDPASFVISVSADGVTKAKHPRVESKRIRPGDAIMVAPSSGVHANGLTLCREIAERLSHGYQHLLYPSKIGTIMGGPSSFGEALLVPTPIYSTLVEDLLDAGVDIHYAVNITGHGWRKFMRAPQPLVYNIPILPPQPPVFKFIQEEGKVDDREMYGNFNMGAGFGLYINHRHIKMAEQVGKRFDLLHCGMVEAPSDGRKRVLIGKDFLQFMGEELKVRS
jgi:phosphoribosylformylglycinamidine cyclo-ligase